MERFNGTMRDEVLNGEVFETLLEARVVINDWRRRYNEERPHRGLGVRVRNGKVSSSVAVQGG